MEQVVLNANLIHIFNVLTMEQRGILLTALLERVYHGEDKMVEHIFCYVMTLQEQIKQKKQHLKEIGEKGRASRWGTDGDTMATPKQRKEAKENNNINKNKILNIFGAQKSEQQTLDLWQPPFVPPSVTEVKVFVQEQKLAVDAETFVNFYESHGWMVGTTPIKNWQATLKLWHNRAVPHTSSKSEAKRLSDESYWHELNNRVQKTGQIADILAPPPTVSLMRNATPELQQQLVIDLNEQPFARFMHRVEKFDLNQENKND